MQIDNIWKALEDTYLRLCALKMNERKYGTDVKRKKGKRFIQCQLRLNFVVFFPWAQSSKISRRIIFSDPRSPSRRVTSASSSAAWTFPPTPSRLCRSRQPTADQISFRDFQVASGRVFKSTRWKKQGEKDTSMFFDNIIWILNFSPQHFVVCPLQK